MFAVLNGVESVANSKNFITIPDGISTTITKYYILISDQPNMKTIHYTMYIYYVLIHIAIEFMYKLLHL